MHVEAEEGGGDQGAARRGPWDPVGGGNSPPPVPRLGPQGASRAWVGRAGTGVGGRPTPSQGGQVLGPGRGAGSSLTDLAVRVGDVATAVKTWIMAILQRSAAEPVGPKGSSSGAVRPCP